MRNMSVKAPILAAGVRKGAVLLICAFGLWGLAGLSEFPGFTHDEAPIIDAAISLVDHGHLGVPSAGPGREHDVAYLYQSPLHPIVLAAIFRITGPRLLYGRLLSLVLAIGTLALLMTAMKPFGAAAQLVSVGLLAVDPLFAYRARQVRYDWLALVCVLGAWSVLWGWRGSENSRRLRLLGAGVLLGIAASSHALYLLFAPIYAITLLLLPLREPRAAYERVVEVSLFGVGCMAALIPVGLYASFHPEAIRDQLLFQIHVHQSANRANWLWGELLKYCDYYRRAPLSLVSVAAAFGTLASLLFRPKPAKEQCAVLDNRARSVLLIAFGSPLFLGFASDHIPWHHLMITPFWAMLCGVAYFASQRFGASATNRRLLVGLFALAIVAGILTSWLERSLQMIQGWGSRDLTTVQSTLDEAIPLGSDVFGDYRLLLIARQAKWRFVAWYPVLNQDVEALARSEYPFVVLSSQTETPDWMDLTKYRRFQVVSGPPERFSLPGLYKRLVPSTGLDDNRRIEFVIYKRLRS